MLCEEANKRINGTEEGGHRTNTVSERFLSIIIHFICENIPWRRKDMAYSLAVTSGIQRMNWSAHKGLLLTVCVELPVFNTTRN